MCFALGAPHGRLARVAAEASVEELLAALTALRSRLGEARFPLEISGAPAARAERAAIAAQLDDYLLPRLRRLDAPLLTVVGGSTGAGKSTLVNSLVGLPVSAAGVLRPTTRAPVLVCHPDDEISFADRRVLPELARTTGVAPESSPRASTGAGPTAPSAAGAGSLHLVTAPALPRGLALLDAPDIDSVVAENRELAAQLLAAADLWVFVTTAARYADAVPWDLLRDARERSTALAVVLNRVPPGAAPEVSAHLAQMLAENGLGDAPLFVLAETETHDGMLPLPAITPISGWLRGLAADASSREAVVRRTLRGALAGLPPRVDALAAHAEEQVAAAATLERATRDAYRAAERSVDDGLTDGSLLRGEVLARWQEFVGTGEFLRSLEAQVGRLRDRITAALRGQPQPGEDLKVALETGVEALVRAAADRAAEGAAGRWAAEPGGAALLAAGPAGLDHCSPELPERAAAAIRGWQGYVLELVRRQGQSKRSTARFLSFGVNGVGLALMIVVFAHTGGLTGGEVAVAGGASALSQKLLEAVFGDQAVRRLAADARAELLRRVHVLLADEAERFTALLESAAVDPGQDTALRAAARAVSAAGLP